MLFDVQAFASDRPEYACHALLFFMERSAVIDVKPDQEPSHALPLEVSPISLHFRKQLQRKCCDSRAMGTQRT